MSLLAGHRESLVHRSTLQFGCSSACVSLGYPMRRWKRMPDLTNVRTGLGVGMVRVNLSIDMTIGSLR